MSLQSTIDEATCLPRLYWTVASTQPNAENVAVENLKRQNFDCYQPVIRKTVRHARRARDVLRPLFPGYLFIALEPGVSPWRSILGTRGIRTLIRFGERLSFVDGGFIDGLKAREIGGVILRPAVPHRIGQDVSIAGGPFEGMIARIIAVDERERLVLLMDLLNRPVRVTVTPEQISPV
jgi:transcriptional antiterminator RfaH